MESKEKLVLGLKELRIDNIIKQKKGLHFILASIIIWGAVFGIHLSSGKRFQ